MTDSTGPNVICDTRLGPFLYNRNDKWMGTSYENYGEYSEAEARIFRTFLRPGMVAIDGGANIGSHTMTMAELVGRQGAVFAFEPQRVAYHILCANAMLQNRFNVWPIRAAIGNQRGMIDIELLNWEQPNQSFVGLSLDPDAPHFAGKVPKDKVEILPIDDLGLRAVHFLKLDVEGMELDALRGAANTIYSQQPIIYLEAVFAHKRAALLQWLTDAGYCCWWDFPPLFSPDNYKGKTENVFMDDQGRDTLSFMWICAHKSASVTVNGERVTPDNLHRAEQREGQEADRLAGLRGDKDAA